MARVASVAVGKQQEGEDVEVEEAPVTDTTQCVVCFEEPIGQPLRPCGHRHFCDHCAGRFRTCPFCRVPLAPTGSNADGEAGEERPPILSPFELLVFGGIVSAIWFFIWIGSYTEWRYDVPTGYNATICETRATLASGESGCLECKTGYLNAGLKCFERLEDFPPVETGAAFGGSFYFTLIIITQICGAISEVLLIQRVRIRGLMPRKELAVLGVALAIEVLRMLLVDIFVLQDYFGGSAYQIYGAPIPCDGWNQTVGQGWIGADNVHYCVDRTPRSNSSRYYIATRRSAFSEDTSACSTFMSDSALLDYDEASTKWRFQFWDGGGHARFSRLGWVIGGEFAFYYFFATFVNEIADNFFVIPTTTSHGSLCKLFAIALELFQLGALCPAAIFSHGGCLHYTNPLGMPLRFIRDLIVSFGYCVACIPFFAVPLAVIGFVLVGILVCLSGAIFKVIVWPAARLLGEGAAESLNRCRLACQERIRGYLAFYRAGMASLVAATMMLSFVPLFISGMFLGSLVVVGQASKSGGMQVITAAVLLSDVLFKISATVVTELADYAFHLRVRRAIDGRSDAPT